MQIWEKSIALRDISHYNSHPQFVHDHQGVYFASVNKVQMHIITFFLQVREKKNYKPFLSRDKMHTWTISKYESIKTIGYEDAVTFFSENFIPWSYFPSKTKLFSENH